MENKHKKIVGIIPSRLGSTRFPGKPLKKILALPMIEHVRRRVSLFNSLDEIYVATCDNEIKEIVESSGGKVIMTSKKHERCTDRIEEAAQEIDADIIVNIQGDEPLILPVSIEEVIKPFKEKNDILSSCLIYPIKEINEVNNYNIVKTVLDLNNFIIYFSRSPIPSPKDASKNKYYKQSGIMAFTKDFLHKYSKLKPTPLEKAESVDMLRIIEHGYEIFGVITAQETLGVDIPSDIEKIEKNIFEDKKQKEFYERILSL